MPHISMALLTGIEPTQTISHAWCVCRQNEPGSSDMSSLVQELRGADDHTIINQYFDSIDKLVALVMEGHGAQAKDEGLCDAVLYLQDVSDSVTCL